MCTWEGKMKCVECILMNIIIAAKTIKHNLYIIYIICLIYLIHPYIGYLKFCLMGSPKLYNISYPYWKYSVYDILVSINIFSWHPLDTTVFRKKKRIQVYRRGHSYTSLNTFDRNSLYSEGKPFELFNMTQRENNAVFK